MQHELYEMTLPAAAARTMDDLCNRLHTKGGLGVTHVGNRLTVRWSGGNGAPLKSVHMLILEVEDGRPEQRCPGCGAAAILDDKTGLCTTGDCTK